MSEERRKGWHNNQNRRDEKKKRVENTCNSNDNISNIIENISTR